MKILYLIPLLIIIGGGTATEDSDALNKTAESYATFDEISRLNMLNSQGGNPFSGDVLTENEGLFTLYFLFRGWPAVMCEPDDGPSIAGSECFVDEGVKLENTLLYYVGLKDVDSGTQATLETGEKRLAIDNELRLATLSLQTFVHWTKEYCCTKDGNSWTEGGTVENWFSQTIVAPREFQYNKTHTVNLTNHSWGLTINTSLTSENLGFELNGNVPKCSMEILNNPLKDRDCSKNETISATLSKISPYFKIMRDDKRQLYYGEMVNPPLPPYVERKGIAIAYNSSSEQVEQIMLPEGGTIDEIYVMTPFGKKTVNMIATTYVEKSDARGLIAVWSIVLLFIAVYKLTMSGGMKK